MSWQVFTRRPFPSVAASMLAVLVLATIATQGHAAVPVTVVVRVIGPAAPVRVGEPFTVTLQTEDAANLGAFEFDFGFDTAIAATTVSDIHLGSFLGSTGRTIGELRLASSPLAPGRPLYAAYSYGLPAGPSGMGELATITMLAIDVGTSSLDLGDLKVTDVAGAEVIAASVSGAVEVHSSIRPLYLPLVSRGTP